MGDAAVDGVAEAGLGLVGDGEHRLAALRDGDVEQQLRHVARPEHLVDRREPRRPLLRPEVGREHAVRRALPPQELARPARRPRPARPHFRTVTAATATGEGDREGDAHERSGDERKE